MKNPKFVSVLLEHIGAYVDPLRLIKEIPSGMEIVGLRDRLVKIISDYNLQVSRKETKTKNSATPNHYFILYLFKIDVVAGRM